MKTVLIIGASHAAAEHISALRKKGWDGRIVLVGDEDVLPYQRPPLSKAYYKGEMDLDKLQIKKPEFYTQMDVDLYLGCVAKSIDRQDKSVTLETKGGDREVIHFDKLVIATGTRARYLPIEGGDLPDVHYLRTKADVDTIKKNVISGNKLLIVGAGYIGLEVAASAVRQGVEVTVIEMMSRVLERVTSDVVSEFYQDIHSSEGVDIRLDEILNKIENHQGQNYAVMDDGEKIIFDSAIVGIGVIPNIELAEEAGLPCENGIVVNEFARTADEDIYAIGDCSNHPSLIYDRRIRLESVPNAIGQARTAAMAICGEDVPYDELPWFWSDQYDIKLQTAGLFEGYDNTVIRGDRKNKKFTVYYLKESKLLAVDAINSPADFMVAKKLIKAQVSLSVEQITDTGFALKELL